MKILIIREAFEIKAHIKYDLNNEILFKPQPKHHHHHYIWKSLYFYISMDFPIYLPTKKVFVKKIFFGKSMAGGYPTYLQFGHMSKVL